MQEGGRPAGSIGCVDAGALRVYDAAGVEDGSPGKAEGEIEGKEGSQ